MATGNLFFCQTQAQTFFQDFESLTTLSGWDTMNVSSPLGTSSWFDGNTNAFQAYFDTGYIAADFHNASGTGTISNWLASPVRWMHNGDQLIFWTRKADSTGNDYPDRLQVWLSTIGGSSYFPTTDTGTGSYSVKLLDIDSTYSNDSYNGGYPYTWKRYVINITGLPSGQISCRFAFRYYATNAGPNGSNSGYIGIDSLAYVSSFNSVGSFTDHTSFDLFPNPSNGTFKIKFRDQNHQVRKIKITSILGESVLELEVEKSDIEYDLSYLPKGLYMVNITDENGVFTKILILQ